MVGVLGVVGSSVVDSHTGPCLCVDAFHSSNFLSNGDLVLARNAVNGNYKRHMSRPSSLELSTSFLDHSWTSSTVNGYVPMKKHQKKKNRGFKVSNNLGGQYEDNFEDVKKQMLNYFTYKAVRTVLTQLYEMNPPDYRWFYEFIGSNKPNDGKYFIRKLAKEKHDLAERVMVTRLHLYGRWIKKCDHTEIYNQISDENLALMRERLLETVVWPSDDSNTEKIN
ncbi:hypothetical protein Leryth_009607 [Lithospermum erythrorhizon]|uniref:Chaperonin-like RbcX protein n=1 Tax=Lithospermum erythrorhizon TaxID=34254 RepID=A0AAV3PGJ4_LITER|nr:hypothetical protein Leryth_009607 [Lithospermum erythrorhizon]